MPVLQFKGKSAIECYHHTVPHHTLELDGKLSVLGKSEKPGLKKVLSTSTMHECEPRFCLTPIINLPYFEGVLYPANLG